MVRHPAALSALLLTSLALTVTLSAQSQRKRAGVDPYTGGDQAQLKPLGYASMGPFELGTGHGTADVEELLGTEPLIWIETAHFRIGCSLSPLALRGPQDWSKDWVKSVRGELGELRPKLPKGRLKKRVKSLDPWLRAHLMAQRLERLYAEVSSVLGRDDAWFVNGSQNANDPETFAGVGPYLGMAEKQVVLLLQKSGGLARYTRQ